jgi:hypothetical protein
MDLPAFSAISTSNVLTFTLNQVATILLKLKG